jgi:hypothetical protein
MSTLTIWLADGTSEKISTDEWPQVASYPGDQAKDVAKLIVRQHADGSVLTYIEDRTKNYGAEHLNRDAAGVEAAIRKVAALLECLPDKYAETAAAESIKQYRRHLGEN